MAGVSCGEKQLKRDTIVCAGKTDARSSSSKESGLSGITAPTARPDQVRVVQFEHDKKLN